MIDRIARPMDGSTVFLFGSQPLSFDEESFEQIRSTVLKTKDHQWILDTIAELPDCSKAIAKQCPHLLGGSSSSVSTLEDLNKWFATGRTSQTSSVLPNTILSPLAIITHLIQYTGYLEIARHSLDKVEDLYTPSKNGAETLGFCTGLLTAFAISNCTNREQFQEYGATAIRLGMLTGMVVDAQNAAKGPSKSIATIWHSSEERRRMIEILRDFPDAYISVYYDENRATITSSVETVSELQQQLIASGIVATEIGLHGRFHWQEYSEDVEVLLKFCNSDDRFQLPDASTVALPTRSNAAGEQLTTGSLHEIALRSILLEPPQWYETFCTIRNSSLTNKNSTVISFGLERCVPPSILRGISQQVVQIAELDQASKMSILEGRGIYSDNDIAVVGMSCKVAGAGDLEAFWDLLREGKSQHREVPSERFTFETVHRELDPHRKWYGNFLDGHDQFDHKFFKKTPREVTSMDPQQRQLLQIVYQAVEQSGYFHTPRPETRIGCYVGVCSVDYEDNISCHAPNAFTATGHLRGFIAGKVSHYFGWTGPGLTIDTACSSSAVAVHQACRAILGGECTAAIAGGTHVMTSPLWFQNLAGASFLSKTGSCKPFDAKADGYCRGEGVAAVFLKRLSSAIADGDQIKGVIAGTAVQQNQNCTPIVVPNVPSLSDLFETVSEKSRLKPDQITVVEAHGTGTPVGDPAEYDSVRQVLAGPNRSTQLSLGSVKGLVGHCECTSGLISLIKILLMLQEGYIPPQASFKTLNPAIKAAATDHMQIPTTLIPWTADFRAALINNYGASGSNASMVITEAPDAMLKRKSSTFIENVKLPFWFCGLDDRSLRAYAAAFRKYLNRKTDSGKSISIADVAFNLSRQSNRSLGRNLMFTCRSVEELNKHLTAYENGNSSSASIERPKARPIVFCFGGQVSKYAGLDRGIYDNVTVLRGHLDQCNSQCVSLGAGGIYPNIFRRDPITDPVGLQTCLFALQYSCAKSWMDTGARPVAVVGHSFGELTALCVSGILTLEDAFKMIIARASIIRDFWGPEKGAMIAVDAELDALQRLLSEANQVCPEHSPVGIACYNGPKSFTLAGSTQAVDAVEETLHKSPSFSSIKAKRLNVTNAFHSSLVDPLMKKLNEATKDLTFHEPKIPVMRATEYADDKVSPADYVFNHMRRPVFFNHAIQRIASQYPQCIWLEAGSNSTITNMVGRALSSPAGNHFQSVNITSDSAMDNITDETLNLWKAGVDLSYWAHHTSQSYGYQGLLLPPYQFEKARHWLELKKPPRGDATVKIVNQPQDEKLPETLTTFVGYQDKNKTQARFRINTMIPEYEKLMMGHVMANTAPICPFTVQVDLTIEGLTSLVSSEKSVFRPQIIDLMSQNALCMDKSLSVWLDIEASTTERGCWNFKITSNNPQKPNAVTTHTIGKLLLGHGKESQTDADFARYERLTGHARCVEILNASDADEIIQGRSIYKSFSEIVEYSDAYQGVQRLVGKGSVSAGRVVKKYNPKTWFDPYLSDTFCQIVGVFINCMTDRNPNNMFVAKGVEKWARSPKLDQAENRPDTYDVLAYHQGPTNNEFLTDIFIFHPTKGELLEVILGMSFVKVSRSSIVKLLSRLTNVETTHISPPSKSMDFAPPHLSTNGTKHTLQQDTTGNKVRRKKEKRSSSPKIDILSRLKPILSELVGIEQDQITIDSSLADIGVDSLLAMEVISEIERSFKCTLSADEMSGITEMSALVKYVEGVVGPAHTANEVDDSDDEDSDASTNEYVSTSPAATDTSISSIESVEKVDVLHYFSECLGIEKGDMTATTALRDLGVDSLMSVEVRHDLVSKFGLELADDVVIEDMTLDDLDTKINGTSKSTHKTAKTPKAGEKHVSTDKDASPHEHSIENDELIINPSDVFEAFKATKSQTDKFISDAGCDVYVEKILPLQTDLCIAFTLEAFEKMGCNIRSARTDEELKLFTPLPEHKKLIPYLCNMLEQESRLIQMENGHMKRTDVAYPARTSNDIMKTLMEANPKHHGPNELIFYVGSSLADCLSGKTDGIKLIFGSEEGRNRVSRLYGDWEMNRICYKHMEDLLAQLISRLSESDGPVKILEMGAGTAGTSKWLIPLVASLNHPVEYTFTDLAPSLVAAARKQFKQYPFVKYRAHDIEKEPAQDLLNTQHIVIASNAVHATHSLINSARNIKKALKTNGILMMLEMVEPLLWIDMIFGLFEGWWFFDDGRVHALTPPARWKTDLHSSGFGYVDWTEGVREETKVNKVIIGVACEQGLYPEPEPPGPLRIASREKESRQSVIDDYVRKHTLGFSVAAPSVDSSEASGECIAITGATGSIGSHLVEALVKLPNVKTVVCLNRRGNQEPKARQLQSLTMKGIFLSEDQVAKLRVLECDTSKMQLGLPDHVYLELVVSVSHIIHNAWPMSIKRPVKGFESQLHAMRNLIDLASDASGKRPRTTKVNFQFISSIAVIGHYPMWKNEINVPEERMPLEAVLPIGYGEAKYICELMLDKTLHQHPDRFRTSTVRIGQIAGSKSSGFWNPNEHLSFLFKSSQTLKKLPRFQGPLSWTPVDDVAATLVDLVFHDNPYPIYHIDNPIRQQWETMLPVLSDALGISSSPSTASNDDPSDMIVPFKDWIALVRNSAHIPEKDNPALKLIDFLDENFTRMSCGGLLLDSTKTQEHSETLRMVGPVSDELATKYVRYWKHVGFLA